jgi:SAM-dependent methyltransferase
MATCSSPLTKLIPHIRWAATEHPDRLSFNREDFMNAIRDHNCTLSAANITEEPLPFPNHKFSVVTFSETLGHLPVEKLNFVLSEIAPVTRPDGILLMSSPNQASLENRVPLLKGKSILEMPNEYATAKGIFGHIRLYTPVEMESAMSKLGSTLEHCVLESNNSGYRGASPRSILQRLYRLYERAEGRLGYFSVWEKLGTWCSGRGPRKRRDLIPFMRIALLQRGNESPRRSPNPESFAAGIGRPPI